MPTDPLQQLRDVHLPLDPGWWPPAIGWWLLSALVAAAIAGLVLQVMHRYMKRRPIRQARVLIEGLFAEVAAGSMTPLAFLHAGNEVLKRALVPGLGHRRFASLSGDAWLEALNELTGTSHFTDGPGRILGNERFKKHPQVDPTALRDELLLVLAKVSP